MQTQALFTLFAITLAASAVGQDTRPKQLYFPTPTQWRSVTAEEAGCSQRRLDSAMKFAERSHSTGVVVLWRGRILAERYWDGWTRDRPHFAYSVSKSLVSTLIGMAIEEGKIEGVDQSASDFLSEWQANPQHRKITIHDMLSMSAGLEGGTRVFLKGAFSRDERAFATSLPVQHKPGTYWEYHNSAYRLHFNLIDEASGQSLQQYTQVKLLTPLGMGNSKWETKRFNRRQNTFMSLTPRDAARYGLFVLAEGAWNGKQLVNRDWIRKATRPSNKTLNPSYGYLWWLNCGSFHYLPLNPNKQAGPIFPGCPPDAIGALGKDDQAIYVVPSLDLVVTRFGDAADSSTPATSKFDADFLGAICRSFATER